MCKFLSKHKTQTCTKQLLLFCNHKATFNYNLNTVPTSHNNIQHKLCLLIRYHWGQLTNKEIQGSCICWFLWLQSNGEKTTSGFPPSSFLHFYCWCWNCWCSKSCMTILYFCNVMFSLQMLPIINNTFLRKLKFFFYSVTDLLIYLYLLQYTTINHMNGA